MQPWHLSCILISMSYSGHFLYGGVRCNPTHSCGMVLATTMFIVAAWVSQPRLSSVMPSYNFIILAWNSWNLWPCRGLTKRLARIWSMEQCSRSMRPLAILYSMKKYWTFICFVHFFEDYLPFISNNACCKALTTSVLPMLFISWKVFVVCFKFCLFTEND